MPKSRYPRHFFLKEEDAAIIARELRSNYGLRYNFAFRHCSYLIEQVVDPCPLLENSHPIYGHQVCAASATAASS